MEFIDEVRSLAIELNLEEKIDFEFNNFLYFQKWKVLLNEVKILKKDFELEEYNLKNVNPNSFINYNYYWNEILKNIHEDYDISIIKNNIKERRLSNHNFVCNKKSYNKEYDKKLSSKNIKIPPPNFLNTIKTFIIDIDWENTSNGASIFLYTRDEFNLTRLITIPFEDYFYIKVTNEISESLIKNNILNFCNWLRNVKYKNNQNIYHQKENDSRKHYSSIDLTNKSPPKLVTRMEIVSNHKSIYGYQSKDQTFLKIYTSYPDVTSSIFNFFSKKYLHWEFFEVKCDYINKFLTKHKLSSCLSINIEKVIDNPFNNLSYCDYLVETTENNIVYDDKKENRNFKVKQFFYDIECLSLDHDVFPNAKLGCPIIQISYLLSEGNKEIDRGVLCLKNTPGEYFECFDFEDQMLIRFAQIILNFNPDCLVGYNSNAFDMPYILDRMEILGIKKWASQFTRRKNLTLNYIRKVKASKQMGTVEITTYISPGRLLYDQMEALKADVTQKLDSYSLKFVCATFLKNDNKEELRYRDIPDLYKTKEGRVKIANYCLKDGELLFSLDKVLMFSLNLQSMTKVLGTTLDNTFNRGLSFKLMGKIKQYSESFNFLIPTFTKDQHPVFEGSYQGAFVLDPDVGFHTDPVVVLDYASLYPSLMIYYNLSWDTYVIDKNWAKKNTDKCEVMDNNEIFVTKNIHFGILPKLELELGKERKEAKKKKNEATTDIEKNIWDCTQLAIKVICNSLYGLLGAPTAQVPMVQIAATITAMGRFNLLMVKKYVEDKFCEFTCEKEENRAKVVYGDTDSIFIKMPNISVKKAIEYGFLLEKNITRDLYCRPHSLIMEMEKCFCPFLLLKKKFYAGKKYEFDDKKSKLSCNGLKCVKRDSPEICRTTMQTFYDLALMKGSVEEAKEFIKSQIKKLMLGEFPLTEFILTKKISKRADDYKIIPPHIKCWLRQVNRIGKSIAPSVGEPFKFILTRIDKKKKNLSHAMIDLILAEEKNLVYDIDKNYYIKTFIDNPLRDSMNLVLGENTTKQILDTSNYERVEIIKQNKNNLLSFLNKSVIKTSSKKRDFFSKNPNKKQKTINFKKT